MNSKHHSQHTDGPGIAQFTVKMNKLVSSKSILKKTSQIGEYVDNFMENANQRPNSALSKLLRNNKAAQEFSRSRLFSQVSLAGGDGSEQQTQPALQLGSTDRSTLNNKNYQKQSNATLNTPISRGTSAATIRRQNYVNVNGGYKTQSTGTLKKYLSSTERENSKISTIVRDKFAQSSEDDVLSMQNFTKTRAVSSHSNISRPTTAVPSAYQQHPNTLSQRLQRSGLLSEHSTLMSPREGGPDTLRDNISGGAQTARQQLLNSPLSSARSGSPTAQFVAFQEKPQNLATFSTKKNNKKLQMKNRGVQIAQLLKAQPLTNETQLPQDVKKQFQQILMRQNEDKSMEISRHKSVQLANLFKRKVLKNPVPEKFREVKILMSHGQDEFVEILKTRQVNNRMYELLFQFLRSMLDTGDDEMFCQLLILCGDLMETIGQIEKAYFFYNQCRMACDLIQSLAFLKSLLFIHLADLTVRLQEMHSAIILYKRALQYAWYYDQDALEITIYDKLGVAYYYLFDAPRSKYYHERAVNGDHETRESPYRKRAMDSIDEYYSKQKYKQPKITHFLLAHLSLPISIPTLLLDARLSEDEKRRQMVLDLQSLETKRELFYMENARHTLNKIISEAEFKVEMDTPKCSFRQSNAHLFEKSTLAQQHMHYPDPRWMQPDYNTRTFGKIVDSNAYEKMKLDIDRYKLTLDKKLELRMKQTVNVQESYKNAYDRVDVLTRFLGQVNKRVRVTHLSPNRSAVNFEKFASTNWRKVNKLFDRFSKLLISKNDSALARTTSKDIFIAENELKE